MLLICQRQGCYMLICFVKLDMKQGAGQGVQHAVGLVHVLLVAPCLCEV